jgi:hypothetical protein
MTTVLVFSGKRAMALALPDDRTDASEKCTTTGTDEDRGGVPESSATTTMWASLLFRNLK